MCNSATTCIISHLAEYCTRLACSPNKVNFVKAPLNVIDLLAILPYFLSFVVEEIKVIINYNISVYDKNSIFQIFY